MGKRVDLLLGTGKGVFIAEGREDRREWRLRGPMCDTWPINHVKANPANGAIHAAGGSQWHGVDVWTTHDGGEAWTKSGTGIAYPEGEDAIDAVWSLGFSNGRIYAGVRPAGLFESADGGESWQHVQGLRDHPTRADWNPGGAGLTLHHIVTDPGDPARIWVGISAAGVFFSDDAGQSWEPRNTGVRCDFLGEGATYPPVGQCVHGIALAPGGQIMYQQNHCGMYRSDDAGATWQSVENGLPSEFGFPVTVHPRDPDTAWLLPMNSAFRGRYVPEAKAAVWRTRDGGQSWQDMRAGLPQEHCYFTVLRQAMAVDTFEPAGVYFGTNSGSLYASADEGETWDCVARDLPLINSVETMVVES